MGRSYPDLFLPQDHDRIYPGGSARRNHGGRERYGRQNLYYRTECNYVDSADGEQQAGHQASQYYCADQAADNAHRRELHSLSDHQPDDVVRALVTELENSAGDGKGKDTSGRTVRSKVPRRGLGADCS